MFRELAEEVVCGQASFMIGCAKELAALPLAQTFDPARQQSRPHRPKQIWFLLRMLGGEEAVRLDLSERPGSTTGDGWTTGYPLRAVVPSNVMSTG